MSAPIILTLQLDAAAAEFLDAMRRRYFPPAINHIGAHLTLFHNLPCTEEITILHEVAQIAAVMMPFDVAIVGPMKLGRGVALKIDSDELLALRARLAKLFDKWLIAQDRQKFRPHVTIQNKVAPHEASALYDHLSATLTPFTATAEAIQLWRYEGGPWSPIAAVPFQAGDKARPHEAD